MSDAQDEDNWLYGNEKEEADQQKEPETSVTNPQEEELNEVTEENQDKDVPEEVPKEDVQADPSVQESTEEEQQKSDGNVEDQMSDKENEIQPKKDEDDDSSSDDEPTVTIGKIVKQPDIIRAPLPTHRAPATTGPKDEDFDNIGKINDVPITDYNLAEFEDKPWRKPGADLSDYFNYGFTEETWIRYCERQKSLRLNESQVGLIGLGTTHKIQPLSNVPVTTSSESKYLNGRSSKVTDANDDSSQGNTIQVMTAEKRTYSNKVLTNQFDNDFSTPPPFGNFYNRPPPTAPYYAAPPPMSGASWPVTSIPPPGWNTDAPGSTDSPIPHYEESSHRDREERRDRSDRDIERSERHRSRERESRHHRSRRSRSRSKPRHKKRSRTRSRSRTPSHRHKRSKKSKRESD